MQPQNQKKSIIQIVCSFLLLVVLFLPWLTLSYQIGSYQEQGQTISFFDALQLMLQSGEQVSNWSTATSHFISNYAVLLYIIPILLIINIIMQLIKSIPVLSFYASIIPALLSYTLLYYSVRYEFNMQVLKSPGTIITLFAGSIALIEAWLQIGYACKRYKGYLFFLIGCILLGVIGIIISIAYSQYLYRTGSYTATGYGSLFMYIILTATQFLGNFGFLHIPFLFIGGIGMAIASGKRQDLLMESSANSPQNSAIETTQSDENPVIMKKEESHIPESPTSTILRYAPPTLQEAYKKEKEKETEQTATPPNETGEKKENAAPAYTPKSNQEEENLRYAPPQYRKE